MGATANNRTTAPKRTAAEATGELKHTTPVKPWPKTPSRNHQAHMEASQPNPCHASTPRNNKHHDGTKKNAPSFSFVILLYVQIKRITFARRCSCHRLLYSVRYVLFTLARAFWRKVKWLNIINLLCST